MAAKAISLAGGINIASDAKALREGTSIASYGVEKDIREQVKIDVFVSQRGAMNSGEMNIQSAFAPVFMQ